MRCLADLGGGFLHEVGHRRVLPELDVMQASIVQRIPPFGSHRRGRRHSSDLPRPELVRQGEVSVQAR